MHGQWDSGGGRCGNALRLLGTKGDDRGQNENCVRELKQTQAWLLSSRAALWAASHPSGAQGPDDINLLIRGILDN